MLVGNLVLQENALDRWTWENIFGGEYSIKGAYQMLMSNSIIEKSSLCDHAWNKFVLVKVSFIV